MSVIVVEGHKIDTKDIFSIDDCDRWHHGFIIRMIGKKDVRITQARNDSMFIFKIRELNDRYRRLEDEVRKQWEADKTELKTFKL